MSELECRRKPKIWSCRSGDWKVNLKTMMAQCRSSVLIDPFSPLAQQIGAIFDGFVEPDQLTIFQVNGRIHVEIKSLSLSFYVTRSGSLSCTELRALVDRNQDAGTLYGFQSMLVLRDWTNASKRSIIVSLGRLNYRPEGLFTVVRAQDGHAYELYGIDASVGRLTCAPEPRLLYTKAQLHACTSFLLPDPLTQRTGCEEALHLLQSAICQPWESLSGGAVPVLEHIAGLSPRRQFYPESMEVMESFKWNPLLPWWMQHDSYRPTVQRIFDKARELDRFVGTGAAGRPSDGPLDEVAVLRRRAERRRSRFEPSGFSQALVSHTEARRRHRSRFYSGDKTRVKVRWMMHILNGQPFRISPLKRLSAHLQKWQWMCPAAVDKIAAVTLRSLLDAAIHDQW